MTVVRRALQTRAVGHAGTLDPFATGLLVILVGQATRLARFVERQVKGYWAEAVLGASTSTDDFEGDVLWERIPAQWPDEATVRAALTGFVGSFTQRPPTYSARRVGGRRGYELARRGEPVTLAPTEVTVYSAELVAWNPPVLEFRAAVSPGTYLRALARDLGERLGTGAHLRALRREWIGPLRVADALPLEVLGPQTPLLAPAELVRHLPQVELSSGEAAAIRQGRAIPAEGASGTAAVLAEGQLLAVAEGTGAAWQPRVVLVRT